MAADRMKTMADTSLLLRGLVNQAWDCQCQLKVSSRIGLMRNSRRRPSRVSQAVCRVVRGMPISSRRTVRSEAFRLLLIFFCFFSVGLSVWFHMKDSSLVIYCRRAHKAKLVFIASQMPCQALRLRLLWRHAAHGLQFFLSVGLKR